MGQIFVTMFSSGYTMLPSRQTGLFSLIDKYISNLISTCHDGWLSAMQAIYPKGLQRV